MHRTTYFNSPFLLGFDHLERLLERTAKSASEGYPPYNIEETGPDRLRITLAIAGFTRDELDLTVEDNQLVIRGKQTETGDRTFLHRGIAARQFQRAFVLAGGPEHFGFHDWIGRILSNRLSQLTTHLLFGWLGNFRSCLDAFAQNRKINCQFVAQKVAQRRVPVNGFYFVSI